ncbi:MAG: single-stranded-DNA-specific exonuclease RecJ [Gammaproteobacteria bacterium]|nr:single-stranded-DNA-specific exonuclease RecJ [Gammaproteobacteria bacterium]
MKIQCREVPSEDALPAELHPLMRRILAARGVLAADELELSARRMLGFDALSGIAQAVALLARAVREDERIIIVGDFDADGATASALAVLGLTAMGASDVRYIVPNRFEYGYGLTPEIVALAAEQQPRLLVTVDNGISSIEGVSAARARGMQVLITDHHLPGEALPAADAIVNPNLRGDGFPSKNLAGVGVMFYVLLALRAHLRESGWFGDGRAEPNMAEYLDLVALGTVADVVPLDRNNRILVAQGLHRIRSGRCRPGITALLNVAGRSPRTVRSADLGFYVAPRLNAAGRLTDMGIGIECLLSGDASQCRDHARRLHQLNVERRAIEKKMQTQAGAIVEALPALEAGGGAGICLFDDRWHQGVIGILASRIKDQMRCPVVAFAPADDGALKGSARSIEGVHIRDVLAAIATEHPRVLQRFGGHAMAAGLSLARENLDAFRAAFNAEIGRHLDDTVREQVYLTDGVLAEPDFNLPLARAVCGGFPWGQAFPEPLFEGEFDVESQRVVGDAHLKLRLRIGGVRVDAIAFNASPEHLDGDLRRIHTVYRLDVNEFRGVESLQLRIECMEAA